LRTAQHEFPRKGNDLKKGMLVPNSDCMITNCELYFYMKS